MVYHPLGYLDRLSTTRYSSRAAAASACAADQGRFKEYKDALFANQPEEGGPGLTDGELARLGHVAGIEDNGFARCIDSAVYLPWAEYVTARAVARGVSGTPSVYVQGRPVPADPGAISTAVAAVLT
jgi:protein-disulfide isomerase